MADSQEAELRQHEAACTQTITLTDVPLVSDISFPRETTG